jgi:hypothetical protein
MRKPIPALVALAVLGPLLLLAAPADAASRYSVSVAVGADRADVGQGVVLSGKVGPKAKGERVKVQRLVGTAWTTVARVKLNRHSRYTATVTVAAPGDNLFRVLKPRSDGHKAGASPTVTVVGWRWRSLSTLPNDLAPFNATWVASVTFRDLSFAPALKLGSATASGGGNATFVLGGLCSAFTSHVGMTDDSAGFGPVSFEMAADFLGGAVGYSLMSDQSVFKGDDSVDVYRGPAVMTTIDKLYLGAGTSQPADYVAWGDPKVYCRS